MLNSNTPNRDAWQERVNGIDVTKEYKDLSELKTGDVLLTKTGTLGFVKKINPKKVIIESSYGGWNGTDIEILTLNINKNDIAVFKKRAEITGTS